MITIKLAELQKVLVALNEISVVKMPRKAAWAIAGAVIKIRPYVERYERTLGQLVEGCGCFVPLGGGNFEIKSLQKQEQENGAAFHSRRLAFSTELATFTREQRELQEQEVTVAVDLIDCALLEGGEDEDKKTQLSPQILINLWPIISRNSEGN